MSGVIPVVGDRGLCGKTQRVSGSVAQAYEDCLWLKLSLTLIDGYF